MKKVALINPGKEKEFGVTEPLNLGYIASYLEQNKIEVKIIDEAAKEDIRQSIFSYKPDIVGITITTPVAPRAYWIADRCRKIGILTVAGGVHATIIPEEALNHFDIVVKGEGEQAMVDIVRKNIKSGIITGSYTQNLDELPPPARHLLNMDFYMKSKDRLGDVAAHLHFIPFRTKFATMITSRGCPYNCIFCYNSWRKAPLRFNSAERIISELENLINNYGIEAVAFIEDNFVAYKPRLEKVCQLIKEKNLNFIWGCNATSNHIDLPTCRMLKDAGCQQLCFGWESGSQRILKILGKNTTVKRNTEAIKICKEVGLMVTGSFMVGSPTETIEDVRATMRFIEENVDDIDMYGVNITTPFPGTKLWQWCEEQGLIPKSFNWADFNLMKTPIAICNAQGMSSEKIKELQLELFSIKKVKFARIFKRAMWHPLQSVGWALKYPSTAGKIIFKNLIKNK